MIKDYTKAAKELKNLGISVVPLRTDGSKLPKIEWRRLQEEYLTDKEIDYHFKRCGGIAAITGRISRLYVLDFDLKYQFQTQDFWAEFMAKVPIKMKKKFYVNSTRNNGMHIWLRTDFEDQSKHYTRRVSTIPELMAKYDEMIKENADPLMVSEHILKKPYEVVIESRSRKSYAVFLHPDYKHVWGNRLKEFSVEEVEYLNNIAYSLDYEFIPRKPITGDVQTYKTVVEYNNNVTPEEVLQLLEGTGMYKYVSTERDGTILILRTGGKSKYSGKIFGDNSVLFLHSSNAPLFDTTGGCAYSPFEVFQVCKGLTYEQAVKELKSR